MGALDNDAGRVNQGLQTAPSDVGPKHARGVNRAHRVDHSYRSGAVTLQFNTDVDVATSTVRANAQYGAGEATQHYIPNLGQRFDDGHILAFDANGASLRVGTDDAGFPVVHLGDGQVIALHNLDLAPGATIPTWQTVEGVVNGAHFLHQTYVVGYDTDYLKSRA